MRILLIYPTRLDEDGAPIKYRYLYLPPLAVAQVAALCPGHEVAIVSDAVDDIEPYITAAEHWDLVGISGMTLQSERMYQLAEAFSSRGTPVVMGGPHPTTLKDEASKYGSVVVGEAENIWAEVLDDVANGRLKDFYYGERWDMQRLIIPRWDLFDLNSYFGPPEFRFSMIPIFTARGCPFGCRFCLVPSVFGKTYRYKPISNILREIDAANAERYFFVDDNIFAQPDYSRELFKALKGKGIRWVSQASTTMLDHPALIELAGESGCFSLLIGIESIDQAVLSSVAKDFNKVELYPELFEKLYRTNIVPYVSLIVGLDSDTPHTFGQILAFLKRNYILNCVLYFLTPMPGTELYEEVGNRRVQKRWSAYEGTNPIIRTRNLSPSTLRQLYWSTFRKFYQICREFTNEEVRQVYPMLSDEIYWLALLYQQYGRWQVNANLHPFSIGSDRY